jgi:hypothetical protein
MKKIWNILFVALFAISLFLLRPRQDVVFGAIDESQYIRLFENGKEFNLCVEENNIFTGTYTLSMDTVFLVYQKPELLTEHLTTLPRKLYINNTGSHIQSIDGKSFSAEIYIDARQKSDNTAPDHIKEMNHQSVPILAAGTRN